jgi:protein-S-isoprenylcysteine O-methyltransferase Ste14
MEKYTRITYIYSPVHLQFSQALNVGDVRLEIYLPSANPRKLNERVTVLKPDQKTWDKIWLLLFYALSLAWFVLMALDAMRWRWSQVSLWLQGMGLLFFLGSLVIIFFTVRENSYLSPTVRIQSDRGHTVIASGPYGSVRHPLYAGACLFYVGVPLLLGSWIGFALASVFIGMLILRAGLEEHMLLEELPGYGTYMKKVTKRFIPRIW